MTTPNPRAAVVGDVRNIVLPSPKSIGTIGGLYIASLDAPMPDDDFSIDPVYTLLGFIADDGLDEDENRTSDKKYAWGSDQVAEPQTEFGLTLAFKLLEFLNVEVAKLAYGADRVTETAATATHGRQMTIFQTSDTLGQHTFLLDTFSPGGKRVQKWFPIGEVKKRKTQKWSHKEILSHDIEVTFYPDPAGRYSRLRTDDGILDA